MVEVAMNSMRSELVRLFAASRAASWAEAHSIIQKDAKSEGI